MQWRHGLKVSSIRTLVLGCEGFGEYGRSPATGSIIGLTCWIIEGEPAFVLFKMTKNDETLDARMVERVEALEKRMGRLEDTVKLFVAKFRQSDGRDDKTVDKVFVKSFVANSVKLSIKTAKMT